MPAIRTEAQREASRINGAKSRGPVTPEGKNISRRNALRHGCSPDTVLVADQMQAEVEQAFEELACHFAPRDEHEARLVHIAAVSEVSLVQLMRAETDYISTKVRHAIENWDERRASEIDQLAELLETQPAVARRRLLCKAEGRDFLADQWDALAGALRETGTLDDDQRDRALRLLPGVACDAYLNMLAALDADDVNACSDLLRFMESEREAHIKAGDDLWERVDSKDRAEAPQMARFDPGPEYARLARYMAAAERRGRQAIAELRALRDEGSSERAPRTSRSSFSSFAGALDGMRMPDQSMPSREQETPPTAPVQNEPDAAQAPATDEVFERILAEKAAIRRKRSPLKGKALLECVTNASYVPITIAPAR